MHFPPGSANETEAQWEKKGKQREKTTVTKRNEVPPAGTPHKGTVRTSAKETVGWTRTV